MSKGNRLIDHKTNIQRGTILRCTGKYPYEKTVDFMLIEYPNDQMRQYALLVVSGYKAGLIFVVFPHEANDMERSGINSTWLTSNWLQWGYSDCDLVNVLLVLNE